MTASGDLTPKSPYFNWKEFVCGWGAAFINVTISYPVNKLIFRQMLHGIKAHSAFSQLRNEGFYFLYRGILPPLCQKTMSLSLMFGVYEEVRQPMIDMNFDPYMAKIVGGMVAGTAEAILMPFERIQTLLADANHHNQYKNTLHAFQSLRKYGYAEYYRGLVPIVLRNGPSNVGFFILRDEVQARLPKYNNEVLRTCTEFICGAMIGAVLSSIFYPFNVLKVAMQRKVGGEFENVFKVLIRIYRERGGSIKSIYHGVHLNCTKACVSWGIMNTAYEHIKAIIY